MFMILRDESFSMNGSKKKKVAKKNNSLHNTVTSMLGSKFRSKTGCLTCRKRKRKCDETHPFCNYCKTRGLECNYSQESLAYNVPNKGQEFNHISSGTETIPSPLFINSAIYENSISEVNASDTGILGRQIHGGPMQNNQLAPSMFQESEKMTSDIIPNKGTFEVKNIMQDDEESNSIENMERHNDSLNFDLVTVLPNHLQLEGNQYNTPEIINEILPPSLTKIRPSSIPSLYLDNNGLSYLDYYQHKVARILSIGQDSMNYFTKFYYTLAYNEESFLYVVTSWGALYSGEDSEIKSYLNRAIRKFNENFNHKNSTDTYFKICFDSILCGYYTCLGDTSKWKQFHDASCQLIKENGGLKKFCKKFNFTNEIRFIVSNIQYIEVTSSHSHKYGTQFPMEEYEELLDQEEFKSIELDYGIDTLQGVQQALYTFIGKLINVKVRINTTLVQLSNCHDTNEYFELKNELCRLMNDQVGQLSEELDNIEPNYRLLNLIKHKPVEYELYLVAFSLYKLIATVYMKLYLNKITPKSLEIQQLIQQTYPLMDELINTKFCVILCFPLIMAGHCCINKFDRQQVEIRIAQVRKLSPVLNIDKTWVVIKEAWNMNPDGELIIDWADTCDSFGWMLNVC